MKHTNRSRISLRRVLPAVIAVLSVMSHVQCVKGGCAAVPANIVSWWKAEGGASDELGNNSGVLVNAAGFGGGEVGLGFSLSGPSNYVAIPSSTSLDIGKGDGVTIEAWINLADNASHPVVDWSASGTYGVHIWTTGTGGFYFNVADSGGGSHSVSSPNGLLLQGTFQHVAATYDKASGTVRLFYNGSVVLETSIGSFTPRTSTDLNIGYRPPNVPFGGNAFNGLIDELAIYNRALSTNEISTIYAASNSGKCSTSTPPFIFEQPSDQAVLAGQTAVFKVLAGGSSPLSYQWFFGAAPISGATGSSLVMSYVQPSQAGAYFVQVTNGAGTTNSSSASLTVNQGPACASAPPGLVSWWQAESSPVDMAGTNVGVIGGAVGFSTGEVGRAFAFGNPSSYVRVPASATLDVGAGNGLTIEGWINPAAIANYPIADWSTAGSYGAHFWVGCSGNCLYANLFDTNGVSHVFQTPSGVVTAGAFQHVAVTYDKPSGVGRIYLNGAIQVETNIGSFTPLTSTDLFIGNRQASGAFNGLIDELSLYSRALDQSEIQAIYNAASSGKCYAAAPPSILVQPQTQGVLRGSTAILSVAARGSPPLSYQWKLNGTNIVGATDYRITITNVQPGNAGNYSVTITNGLGSVTSSNAQLRANVVVVYGNGQFLSNPQYTFSGQVSIQLQNYFANGMMFYTLDGSTPTFSSRQYTGPFVLKNNATVRALGFSADFTQSGQSDPVSITVIPAYTLTVTSGGGGSVTLNPFTSTYVSNTLVTVAAVPASSNWMFLQWLGDLSGANPTNTVVMNRNKSAQALFGTTLSTTVAGGGTVMPSGGVYPYGSIVRLTAIPQVGSYFGIWGNAASGNTNPLYFSVVAPNPTVSALFSSVSGGQAGLTVVPVGDGKVVVSPRANVYTNGQTVSVTATPDSGQAFLGWSGDASGAQNPLNVTMSPSKTIYANFTTRPGLRGTFTALQTEGARLTVTGDFAARFEIDLSSNLTSWTTLVTVTNSYGTSQFTDVSATNATRRFYRAVLLP